MWPFRRKPQRDAFGRVVTRRAPAPPPRDAFVHAPDATPEEVPDVWRAGFDGYEIEPPRGGLTGSEVGGGSRAQLPPWASNGNG